MGRLFTLTSQALDTKAGQGVFKRLVRLLFLDALRHGLVRGGTWLTGIFVRAGRRHGASARTDRERMLVSLALLDTIDRAVDRHAVSSDFLESSSLLWTRALVGSERDEARKRFRSTWGAEPPWVLVVAPTGACNLECPSCYAGSSARGTVMQFDELDSLIDEAKRLWGIKLLVFTGGEPLMYRSQSKGIMDIMERHPDLLCLTFTNGTLIDQSVARRLASLGCPTVALSVEGMRESTDARRGRGAFDKTLSAIDELHDAGVLAGISMTATRANCDELLCDELLDFFFIDRSMFYAFIFQYMPEGRGPDPSLMPTPQQRLRLWERSWDVIERRRIPIFDFWNHGTMIGGCAAAGRDRGYLYVDWDGNVMPCVFAPYAACNIFDIRSRGGTLDDAWASPLLAGIRDWQQQYASGAGPDSDECGRLVRACPVRDHYADFKEIVTRSGAQPLDQTAAACLNDAAFENQMTAFSTEFATLTQALFKAEYDK